MVKAKQQKSKPKRQPQIKKHGNQNDISQIKKHGNQNDISQVREQVDVLGLKIIQVTADGNCFFRALADQLEGDEDEHEKYRSMVVQYILKNREMFEPFIEDEVPFDEYCKSMEKDGTWAGHMELQAASLVTHSNICIHRNMSPRWYIRNFADHEACMVHLSYHDGEHYNSVRLKEDSCEGPARPIIIKADANVSVTSHQAKAPVRKSKGRAARDIIGAGSIKLVAAGTSCKDVEKVKEVLQQVDGDVDAAIEFLVAEQAAEGCTVQNDSPPSNEDASYGNACCHKDEKDEQQRKEEQAKKSVKHNTSSSSKFMSDRCSPQQDKKKISRNQACPCGSKKKYKACCGSVSGRSSPNSLVNQIADSRKGRRERKQGKKCAAGKAASACASDGEPPDMGALCI